MHALHIAAASAVAAAPPADNKQEFFFLELAAMARSIELVLSG